MIESQDVSARRNLSGHITQCFPNATLKTHVGPGNFSPVCGEMRGKMKAIKKFNKFSIVSFLS